MCHHWESTLSKRFSIFYSGIEPGGCSRFFQNRQLKNWTTFCLTKQLFLSFRTRLFLIYSTPLSFLFRCVLFVRDFIIYWNTLPLFHHFSRKQEVWWHLPFQLRNRGFCEGNQSFITFGHFHWYIPMRTGHYLKIALFPKESASFLTPKWLFCEGFV